ncbi:MAG: hypothetical protein ABUL77_05465 [Bacteroidota bacterium]
MIRSLSFLCLAIFLSSCATKPRAPAEAAAAPPPPPAPPPARIKDTPAEKRAALRAADPRIGAEADEQRWGFEAAREQRRKEEEKRKAAAAPPPAPPAPPTGPFDIKASNKSPIGHVP